MSDNKRWFAEARYGLFIHYGLYSLLGRGEWVLSREQIPIDEYKKLAGQFTAEKFDADDLVGRAKKDWGMKYACLTTKHHDGFCLYDSQQTDFTAPKTACGRDLVKEFVAACRKHGMRISLYHSLNDWTTSPSAVDALERPLECHQKFIDFVHAQIREIMTKYGKIDVMWYDGWWPFDARGWQAEKMNAMVRELQPGILVNGRCALPGDFSTPEKHLTPGHGMWEGCMTLNDHWGYHNNDHDWKSPKTVAGMLRQVAAGGGNLLLNVGPKGDGSIPQETVDILNSTGAWLKKNSEAIFTMDRFMFGAYTREEGKGDWNSHGRYTRNGNNFYLHIGSWPGKTLTFSGLESTVKRITFLETGEELKFTHKDTVMTVDLKAAVRDTSMPVVVKFECADEPSIYKSGGYRNPRVIHCRYDPIKSEIQD